jgi:hypothetical protein
MLVLAAAMALATAAPADPPTPWNNYNQVLVNGRIVDDGCTDEDRRQIANALILINQQHAGAKRPLGIYINAFTPSALHRCPISIVEMGEKAGILFIYPVPPPKPVAAAETPASPPPP